MFSHNSRPRAQIVKMHVVGGQTEIVSNYMGDGERRVGFKHEERRQVLRRDEL